MKYINRLYQNGNFLEGTGDRLSYVRLARQRILPLRLIGRLTFESSKCLPRALALTAGLIAMGIKAETRIGKARHYIQGTQNEYHAWTEVEGTPVNDVIQVQKGFHILTTIPTI